MFVFLVITTVVLYLLYSWYSMRPRNYPPGPPYLPLVGSAPFLPRKHIQFLMEKWREDYGPVVGLFMGSNCTVAVCSPAQAVEVLKRDEFQGRPMSAQWKERSFNKRLGLLFNDGPGWMEQRRFTLRHMKEFGFGKTSMEGLIMEEIEELSKELENKTMQVSGLFNLSSVNVLWAVMAGIRYKRDNPELRQLLDNLTEQFRGGNPSGLTIRNILPFLHHISPSKADVQFAKASKDLQDFIRVVIKEHEKTLDENNPRDFLDVYITEMRQQSQEGTTFTEEGLIVVCMDLFSAGAESVGNTLGFALMYMVLHPEIQKKVHDAIDNHIGHSRMPSLQDRASLPYIEAVLLEIQRCNTIAPLTLPHRALRNTELNGHFIPKDTTVLVSLWSLLQDKEHWGDPGNFRPERFLDSAGKLVKDDYLMPFGVGKHLCPGEALARNNLFLFFTALMQAFNVMLPPGDVEPSIVPLPGFTVAPKPFRVTFTPR